MDPETGIPLQQGLFTGTAAVKWFQENLHGVTTLEKAAHVGQRFIGECLLCVCAIQPLLLTISSSFLSSTLSLLPNLHHPFSLFPLSPFSPSLPSSLPSLSLSHSLPSLPLTPFPLSPSLPSLSLPHSLPSLPLTPFPLSPSLPSLSLPHSLPSLPSSLSSLSPPLPLSPPFSIPPISPSLPTSQSSTSLVTYQVFVSSGLKKPISTSSWWCRQGVCQGMLPISDSRTRTSCEYLTLERSTSHWRGPPHTGEVHLTLERSSSH